MHSHSCMENAALSIQNITQNIQWEWFLTSHGKSSQFVYLNQEKRKLWKCLKTNVIWIILLVISMSHIRHWEEEWKIMFGTWFTTPQPCYYSRCRITPVHGRYHREFERTFILFCCRFESGYNAQGCPWVPFIMSNDLFPMAPSWVMNLCEWFTWFGMVGIGH